MVWPLGNICHSSAFNQPYQIKPAKQNLANQTYFFFIKLTNFHAVTLFYYEWKRVAIYLLLVCYSFWTKIYLCKVFDKFQVWDHDHQKNQILVLFKTTKNLINIFQWLYHPRKVFFSTSLKIPPLVKQRYATYPILKKFIPSLKRRGN